MSRRSSFARPRAAADSATACLAIVLRGFGKDPNLGQLRAVQASDGDGVEASTFAAAARAHGLRARIVRIDSERVRHLPRGSVLGWQFNRFVVFERVTRRGVRIFDPAHGRRRVRADVFRRAFSGDVLTFEPGAQSASDGERTRRLARVHRRRGIPHVRQMEATDCGAACLASVLGYFGKQVRLDELRDLTATGRDGVSARALVEAARAHGLRARGVRADLDELEQLPRGSILHWDFDHFVVLDRATQRGVRIVDPALGRRLVPLASVGRAYTGVAITFEPTARFRPGGSGARGTWRYLRPVLSQTRTLGRVLGMSLLLRLLALALPLLTALVVDGIVPEGDRHLLLVLTLGVLALVGYQFLTSFLRGNLLLELRTRLDMHLTMGFVDHLVELPYAFFLRRSSGDLMMRLQSNANVREILTTGSISALIDGSFAALYLALLVVVSPPVALVVLLIALLQIAVMLFSWRRNQRLMSESLQAEAKTQSYAYQLLAGIETLKAAGAEHRAAGHWASLFGDQVNVSLSRGRLTAAVDAAMSTVALAAPLLILLAGAYEVLGGRLSLGSMLAAAALSAGFLQPLATLVGTALQLQLMRSYMERINDVLDTPREQEQCGLRRIPRISGHVRAEAVTFAYNRLGPPVIRDVSLEVQPGSTSPSSAGPDRVSRRLRTSCWAFTSLTPERSASTTSICARSTCVSCAASSASSRNGRICSPPRSATTSLSRTPRCRSMTSWRLRGSPASTRTSLRCPWGTRPRCTTAVPRSPAASSNGSHSRVRSSTVPRCFCSTRRRASSTRSPSRRSTTTSRASRRRRS